MPLVLGELIVLHYLAMIGNLEATINILSRPNVLLHKVDNYGKTPLYYALDKMHLNVASNLINLLTEEELELIDTSDNSSIFHLITARGLNGFSTILDNRYTELYAHKGKTEQAPIKYLLDKKYEYLQKHYQTSNDQDDGQICNSPSTSIVKLSMYYSLGRSYHVFARKILSEQGTKNREYMFYLELSRKCFIGEDNFADSPILTFGMGCLMFIEGQHQEAVKCFEHSTKSNAVITYTIEEIAIIPFELQEEISFLGEITFSAQALVNYYLFYSYKALGKVEKALTALHNLKTHVDKITETDSYAQFSLLGYMYRALGSTQEALDAFRNAFELYLSNHNQHEYNIAKRNMLAQEKLLVNQASSSTELSSASSPSSGPTNAIGSRVLHELCQS